MIFSRGKTKSFDYTSALRQVEADTIARWRSIANGGTEPDSGSACAPEQPEHGTIGFSLGVQQAPRRSSEEAINLVEELRLPETPGDVHETGMWSHGEQIAFDSSAFEAPGFVEELGSDLDEPVLPKEPQRCEVAQEQPVKEERAPLRQVMPCDLNLPAEDDLRRRFGSNIRSALGPGTVIEGTFSFDAPVCIDGTLNGEVRSSSALIVGSHATVNATVLVGSLIVLGKVTGPIQAEELVEIRAGGALEGNIFTKRLVVEDGGCFNGHCHQLP